MNKRINNLFKKKQKKLVTFVTAGDPDYNTSLKIPIIITDSHPIISGLFTTQKDNDITPNKGAISSVPLGIIGNKETILKIKVINKGDKE